MISAILMDAKSAVAMIDGLKKDDTFSMGRVVGGVLDMNMTYFNNGNIIYSILYFDIIAKTTIEDYVSSGKLTGLAYDGALQFLSSYYATIK
jgi:hypothetical protein